MQKRLAAILAADVVDYSRLMGEDQTRTLEALRQLRKELLEPVVVAHNGTVIKRLGDGWIVEFPSISDAVACGITVQKNLVGHDIIRLRVGIHTGEVVFEEDDVFGDGVNIAARLEALANPGQILISDNAYHSLDAKAADVFGGGNKVELKNISRPVAVWQWPSNSQGNISQTTQEPATENAALELPDKPSLAVLPFDNMSGDPEQEFFIDGVVEDILTTLSKVPSLFVIGRNSSFQYKGKSVDLRQVGRELGVRYVVEGSVRKAGNKVRVTAQLIDCQDGQHVWAEKYDGTLEDVFELQDHLTREIVTQLEINLTLGEQVSIWRQRSGSPMVYDAYIKGRYFYESFTRQTHRQARTEFEKALAINATYIPAIIILGYSLVDEARFGWVPDRQANYDKALALAEHALTIDPNYAEIHNITSYALTFTRQHDEAVVAAEKAALLAHGNSIVFHMGAMTHVYAGNFSKAKDYEQQVGRLSPMDPNVSLIELARAQYHLEEYEEVRSQALTVLKTASSWLTAKTILLSALWRLGREEEAKELAASILQLHPKFSVDRWSGGFPYQNEKDLHDVMDPLRAAGLPD